MLRAIEVRPADAVARVDRDRRGHEREVLDVHRARRGERSGHGGAHAGEKKKERRGRGAYGLPHVPNTIRAMPVASAPFAALAREASRFGLAVSAEQTQVCERYASELTLRNTEINLTAITEPADIAHKHFLDSWTAYGARHWTGRERLIDVGSGAGFPGLALRIVMPALRVTLVESVGKKARFLEGTSALLGLSDVEVLNARAEALAGATPHAPSRRDQFDVGTARAVGTLGQVIEYLLPFLRVGGDAIVWKGKVDAEMPGARKAAAAIGGEVVQVLSTTALGVGEELPGRNLVVVRKVKPTPSRYPRPSAEAKRRPW